MVSRTIKKEINPIRLLILLILLVFVWEVLTFLLIITLHLFIPEPLDEIIGGLLDTAFIAPLVYLVLVRPLISQIQQRKAAEELLQSTLGDLENRVKDRILALSIMNDLLQKEITAGQKVKETLELERSELEKRIEECTWELRDEVMRFTKAESQVRMQTTALEAAGNGIIITNRPGIIEWANQAYMI